MIRIDADEFSSDIGLLMLFDVIREHAGKRATDSAGDACGGDAGIFIATPFLFYRARQVAATP
jgi:hypothetical protein